MKKIKKKSLASAKLDSLYKATAPFRETKKKLISKICSVGVRHRWLKYPTLVFAFIFILFVDIAFYLCLWSILHKRAAIGCGIILAALLGLFIVNKDYHSANKLYDRCTEEYFITIASAEDAEAADTLVNTDNFDNGTDSNWYDFSVDFNGLQKLNKDIIGWIHFENEEIDYPILQGENNDKYLRTTYEGISSRAGSIFMECRNNPNFIDNHTIIYGHNMRNLSMFGRLRFYYQEAGYYDSHKYFVIATPKAKYRYEVIACKSVPGDSSVYQVFDEKSMGYFDFIVNDILNDSQVHTDYKPLYDDKIITLSTCTSGDNRFVVSAVRIDEFVNSEDFDTY